MDDSILNTVKKALGISVDQEAFDQDLINNINAVFFTLNQLGVGPTDGFTITGSDDVWRDFIGDDPMLMVIKPYVYMRVKLIFDHPNSIVAESFNKQITEMEFRINVYLDEKEGE